MLPPLRPSNVRPVDASKIGRSQAATRREASEGFALTVKPSRIDIKGRTVKLRGSLAILDRGEGC